MRRNGHRALVKRMGIGLIHRARAVGRRRSLTRQLKARARRLAEAGRLRKYPKDQERPLISQYSFFRKADGEWFDFFYSVYGRASTTFIPLTSYYQVIEPLLNRYALLAAVADKNAYDKLFPEVPTPATPLRRIHGHYYDGGYAPVVPDDDWIRHHVTSRGPVFIKPSLESGSGRGILRLEGEGSGSRGKGPTLDSRFLSRYPHDFVLQEAVEQHPFFAQFNPTSNNTLRVLTYRSVQTDEVFVLHTLLRIGRSGFHMDHDNLGGVAIGIREDGRLLDQAVDGHGWKRSMFNGIHFSHVGVVPSVKEARKAAADIARLVHYGRLLAFDFTVNDMGVPVLLDVNCCGNGVSQYQMNMGSLFNQYTVEVLNHCQENLQRLRQAP